MRPGLPFLPMAFVKKRSAAALSRFVSQKEVNGIALFIYGAIEILPLPFYLDVGFIEPPSVTGSFLLLVKSFLQLRRVVNYPALDGAVVDLESSFLHDLFNVAITQ